MQISARNCLGGTVKAVTSGPVSAEVRIDLGRAEGHATITHGAEVDLGLKEGVAAMVISMASVVILGVPA